MRCRSHEIPGIAKDFLRLALVHKKRSTVMGYHTKLKHLYKYLNDHQLSLAQFTRRDLEDFINRFSEVEYRPATLQHAIGTVQLYLTWLYKCGHLEKDPEPIIDNFPRPKRPDTLPRYLLPDVDALLQKHLDSSKNIVAIALHLMRRIGVRIGDLRSLRYDCLRQDKRGYWYVKIPRLCSIRLWLKAYRVHLFDDNLGDSKLTMRPDLLGQSTMATILWNSANPNWKTKQRKTLPSQRQITRACQRNQISFFQI